MSVDPSSSQPLQPSSREGGACLPAVTSLLLPEAFSQRIQGCRDQFLRADGRFSEEQIVSISGSSDGFDEGSFHFVSGEPSRETGVIRLSVIPSLENGAEAKLPFQHFYPGYTEPLRAADAEISRFLVAPEARQGKSTSYLIEAALRWCVVESVDRLFIDVVDGNLGVSPKSYERHFGFMFTGSTGYDDNYSCPTHLMVLIGRDAIRAVSERLTRRAMR